MQMEITRVMANEITSVVQHGYEKFKARENREQRCKMDIANTNSVTG